MPLDPELQKRLDAHRAAAVARTRSRPGIDAESVPEWDEDGGRCTFHDGQREAFACESRFVFIIAGARSGKSRWAAHTFLREIQRTAEPGTTNCYLIVGPNVEILKKGPLITWDSLVGAGQELGLAKYNRQDKCYQFSKEGVRRLCGFEGDVKVFVGYAHDPDSLQAATYKAVWADEMGQDDFLRESWEAINLRVGIHKGRVFGATTPYSVEGWLKGVVDEIDQGLRPEYGLFRFKATANPRFSQEEYDRIRLEMPPWRAKMFLDGEFSVPEGAIYDVLSDANLIDDPEGAVIPAGWKRHLSMDFGQVNTAAGFFAEATGDFEMYGTKVRRGDFVMFGDYLTGGRSAQEHAAAISRKGLGLFVEKDSEQVFETCVGGTWSEDEWRRDYIEAGLPIVRPPVKEVEVGISRVYKLIKEGSLKFFKNSCKRTVSDLRSYRREIDKRGETSEKIHLKETHHLSDVVRYFALFHCPPSTYSPVEQPEGRQPKKEDAAQFAVNTKVIESEPKHVSGLGQVRVV